MDSKPDLTSHDNDRTREFNFVYRNDCFGDNDRNREYAGLKQRKMANMRICFVTMSRMQFSNKSN